MLAGLRGGTSLAALLITVGLLIFACCRKVQKKKERKKENKGRMEKICLTISLIVLFVCSILYLSVLFISIFQVVVPSSRVGTFCKVLGIFDQITGIWLISMLLVSSYPFLKTKLSGIHQGHDKIGCCKKTWIVCVYVSIIICAAIATTIASITPFFTDTYNPVGGWCWISDEKNCHQEWSAAKMEQIFLWYIPFILGFVICMVLMIMAMWLYTSVVLKAYFTTCLNLRNGSEYCKVFVKVLFQLIILIPLILDIIIFIVRLSGNQSAPVWVLFAIGPPTIGCLIPCSMICLCSVVQNKTITHNIYNMIFSKDNQIMSPVMNELLKMLIIQLSRGNHLLKILIIQLSRGNHLLKIHH